MGERSLDGCLREGPLDGRSRERSLDDCVEGSLDGRLRERSLDGRLRERSLDNRGRDGTLDDRMEDRSLNGRLRDDSLGGFEREKSLDSCESEGPLDNRDGEGALDSCIRVGSLDSCEALDGWVALSICTISPRLGRGGGSGEMDSPGSGSVAVPCTSGISCIGGFDCVVTPGGSAYTGDGCTSQLSPKKAGKNPPSSTGVLVSYPAMCTDSSTEPSEIS